MFLGEQQMPQQSFGHNSYGQNSQVQENLQQVEKDSHSRVKYLRKMYTLLFIQLGFATWITSAALKYKGFGDWINDNSFFTLWVALILFVAIQLTVLMARNAINKVPTNIVFYIIHTLSFAFVLAYWELNRVNDNFILYGLEFFTLVIFSLVIHVLFAKNEITFQSVSLYILGAVYFATLIFEIFVEISTLRLYIIAILAIVWGFFIVWENETIVGAKNQWTREDYFTGAIGVYIYIVLLFLKLVDLIKSFIVKSRS